MRKILVRKLGVGSVAKFVGMANAILAFVWGVFVMFAGIVTSVEQNWTFAETLLGSIGSVVVGLVLLPVIGFALGWVYGVVVALVTNLFLHTAQGIELDVEDGKL